MISGELLIGSQTVRGDEAAYKGVQAATGETMQPDFTSASKAQVAKVCELADAAFDSYRETSPEARARFLETIADNLMALGDEWIERAMAESALPRPRLEGERGRTVGQLRLFAAVVRAGRWQGVVFDTPLPDRQPLPRPDLRSRRIALGPVAVFGASNFPLAFSVAGGDTASALAAGCPVIAKAHPAHPGTSELAGRAIQKAVADCGLHEGVFSLLGGEGIAAGEALVQHPAIQAVGFTGSRRGGLALAALAATRTVPIPVFAEMSSTNPMLLLPAALAARAVALGEGWVGSMTLGVGQFCTKPGLALGIASPALEDFAAAASAKLGSVAATPMLTPGIHGAFCKGISRLESNPALEVLSSGATGTGSQAKASLFRTTGAAVLADPSLTEEVFGPAAILVACKDNDELHAVLKAMEGQLTATLQMDAADTELAQQLLPLLERKAGRILVNGFPTGVEVSYAMVHGGPFPATSDARATSVGAMSIERFLRPVCYQAFPQALLPEVLKDENPLQVPRLVDGAEQQR
jgi:NADP-dependent aldehyde dehydrogenase